MPPERKHYHLLTNTVDCLEENKGWATMLRLTVEPASVQAEDALPFYYLATTAVDVINYIQPLNAEKSILRSGTHCYQARNLDWIMKP